MRAARKTFTGARPRPGETAPILIAILVLLAAFMLSGCAGSWQQQAVAYGQAAKVVVDSSAEIAELHVREMAKICDAKEEIEDYQACLGPIAGHPDRTMAIFESVRAAQLTLFIAVTTEDRTQVFVALAKLKQQIEKIKDLIEAAKAEKASR